MSSPLPTKTDAKFRHALELHQQGKLNQADKLYRSILKSRPNHPDALHYSGFLAHQQGESETAISLIRQAIQQQPNYSDAIMNLGNVYQELERFTEAESCYQQLIEMQTGDVSAYSNMCVCLRQQKRHKEAIAAGKQATGLDPQSLVAWYSLGNAYKDIERYADAIACYQQAIKLKPDFSLAHDGLCQSSFHMESRPLFGRSRFSKTIKAYEQWLACEPENPLPPFMLQAIRGEQELTRAPDEVVRSMFDQFAPRFEQHLRSLEYTLPQQLESWLAGLLTPAQNQLKILDGGCGTGLCAAALKPWARKLTGVDISGAMLAKARLKGLYDEAHESELTGFLNQHPADFDLAVYADTLCYFGDLQDVLQASFSALCSGGLLLFTLEASASGSSKAGYTLHPTGRYSHSENHVVKLMSACGFAGISIRRESHRIEVGKAVPGLVVSARKD